MSQDVRLPADAQGAAASKLESRDGLTRPESGERDRGRLPPLERLTARQREVYDWIKAHIAQRCYPPTVREIAEHFEWASTRAVIDHLARLEKKGVIRRVPRTARGIVLVGNGHGA
jgi:hypothetical protein